MATSNDVRKEGVTVDPELIKTLTPEFIDEEIFQRVKKHMDQQGLNYDTLRMHMTNKEWSWIAHQVFGFVDPLHHWTASVERMYPKKKKEMKNARDDNKKFSEMELKAVNQDFLEKYFSNANKRDEILQLRTGIRQLWKPERMAKKFSEIAARKHERESKIDPALVQELKTNKNDDEMRDKICKALFQKSYSNVTPEDFVPKDQDEEWAKHFNNEEGKSQKFYMYNEAKQFDDRYGITEIEYESLKPKEKKELESVRDYAWKLAFFKRSHIPPGTTERNLWTDGRVRNILMKRIGVRMHERDHLQNDKKYKISEQVTEVLEKMTAI